MGKPMRALATGMSLLLVVMLSGCVFVSPIIGSSRSDLEEQVVEPARKSFTSAKVALVDVRGVISMSDSSGMFSSSPSTIERLREALNLAAADDDVVAVIVRVDSPGGGVTASDLCYREIVRFKESAAKKREKPLPVFAAMLGTAASGGYYAAMAADEVWALPTTVTGSIGVIATFPQIEGLAEKLGVGVRVVKSGDMKDLGSMWREMKDDERAVFQGLIDDFYGRFVRIVADNRPNLDTAAVRKLADGRVYTASQALDAGLVDKIGYLDEVIAAARETAGVDDAAVVKYGQRNQGKSSLYSQTPTGRPTQLNLVNIEGAGALGGVAEPRFHYLWLP